MSDAWSRWLLGGREGGDREVRARLLDWLGGVRDGVLDRAAIKPGDTVLDVGCGDGLIAFGALERVGPEGHVVFVDVSRPLLFRAREAAGALGVLDRCSFLERSATDLAGVADQSVDAVTTRSVLIYVDDKVRALAEFSRVLRSPGRISIWEPINRLDTPEPRGRWFWYDVSPVQDLADRLVQGMSASQGRREAMMGFDDRDLYALAEAAGFLPLHLELRRDIEVNQAPQSWESFIASSPNPLVPSVGEAIERIFTRKEADRFVACLRPQVEEGRRVRRMSAAHLWGVRA
ncbi:MAG: class I SAM-dependent methyltransferase [Candidatus Dormibacteraceae bacterium]